MASLSDTATARYLTSSFAFRPIGYQYAIGLDTATRVIYKAENEIAPQEALTLIIERCAGGKININNPIIAQKNSALALWVREVTKGHGWVAGWKVPGHRMPWFVVAFNLG
jgi:hypothetical protein